MERGKGAVNFLFGKMMLISDFMMAFCASHKNSELLKYVFYYGGTRTFLLFGVNLQICRR
jgi:hypothetical protein